MVNHFKRASEELDLPAGTIIRALETNGKAGALRPPFGLEVAGRLREALASIRMTQVYLEHIAHFMGEDTQALAFMEDVGADLRGLTLQVTKHGEVTLPTVWMIIDRESHGISFKTFVLPAKPPTGERYLSIPMEPVYGVREKLFL